MISGNSGDGVCGSIISTTLAITSRSKSFISPIVLYFISYFTVGNDDSRHVRGEQDSSEGLQYTLSNFPELDVVADYTVGQFAF